MLRLYNVIICWKEYIVDIKNNGELKKILLFPLCLAIAKDAYQTIALY